MFLSELERCSLFIFDDDRYTIWYKSSEDEILCELDDIDIDYELNKQRVVISVEDLTCGEIEQLFAGANV